MPIIVKVIFYSAMSALLLIAFLTKVLPESMLPLLDNIHWTVSSAAMWLLALKGLKRADPGQQIYRRWFAYGSGFYLIGQVLWDIQEAFNWHPFPAPSDLGYLLIGPCFVIGLTKALKYHVTAARHLAIKLDTAAMTVAILGIILVLYMPRAGEASIAELALLIAYPLALFCAASVAMLIIPFLQLRIIWAILLLPVALFVQGLVWMHWNLLALEGINQPGSVWNYLFSFFGVLIGLAVYDWRVEIAENPKYLKICNSFQHFIPAGALLITGCTVLFILLANIQQQTANYLALMSVISVLLLTTIRQSLLLSESDKLLATEKLIEETEKRYERLAYYDPLTGLPNRLLLQDRLTQSLAHAKRNNAELALLVIDLDRFKDVNDSLGHAYGDELIKEIARRLILGVRAGDTLARLGGDEFVLLIENLVEQTQAATIAEHILEMISQPCLIADIQEVVTAASIGISIFPTDAQDAIRMMRNADSAMYWAKELGGDNHQFYTQELTHQAKLRLTLDGKLRNALKTHEFLLYYQPIFSASAADGSLQISGVEALIRWKTASGEIIPPDAFIPCAESNGMIVAIGEWVINQASKQLAVWDQVSSKPLKMSINLSPKQFHDPNLLSTISSVIDSEQLDPGRLIFEVTESALSQQQDQVLDILQTMKIMGVGIALDDFGTGQSSLSRLRQLPFNELKIDKAFIHGIPSNPIDVKLAASIIDMAKALSLTVVAEGVETQEQLGFLRKAGCDWYQGYLLSRPITPDQVAELLMKVEAS